MFGKSQSAQNREKSVNAKAIDDIIKQGEDAIKGIVLQKCLDDNLNIIRTIFMNCVDLKIRELKINEGELNCFLAYIEGAVNKDEMNENVIRPLMEVDFHEKGDRDIINVVDQIKKLIVPVSMVQEINDVSVIVDVILTGSCVLFIDGYDSVLALNIRDENERDKRSKNRICSQRTC
jgi:spore germination protein KA